MMLRSTTKSMVMTESTPDSCFSKQPAIPFLWHGCWNLLPMSFPRLFIACLFFFSSPIFAHAQASLRSISNDAFRPGEKLSYRVHYGFIDAGTAQLEVASNTTKIGPRECYHVIGTGRSVGAFDWFFKVRDRYESFVDVEALVPWLFLRNISEGGYEKTQKVIFSQYLDSVASEKKTISVPDNTQDLISAFYYARTIDFSSATTGQVFPITGYLDDETIPLSIRFIGRENIQTRFGTFRCIKLRPMLQEGRVFKENEDMTVWISDDKNKIPIRVQTDILVGSIKMDITGFENLLHPPAVFGKK
ncbi:MAG: DUF3108 domain-containing protein [Bacteroidota bacterium]